VVLTFDDGPLPPYTARILEILASECVKANYFVVGRMARGYPDLMRRIHADGHVIGTHSENHPLTFDRMKPADYRSEVEQGIASIEAVLGSADAVAPFFRIPGLKRADGVEHYLQSRGLVTWSADVTGDDWRHINASEVVRRVMNRLEEKGKGIVLLHDIQPATALGLSALLRQLKARGYRIVQVVPASRSEPAVVAQPAEPAPAPVSKVSASVSPAVEITGSANASAAGHVLSPRALPLVTPDAMLPARPALREPARAAPASESRAPAPLPASQIARPLTPELKRAHSINTSKKIISMPELLPRAAAEPPRNDSGAGHHDSAAPANAAPQSGPALQPRAELGPRPGQWPIAASAATAATR
jgi:peptidoglycan/xylan/chitin deacetylase (PgdA/CDA1 family)